jgi:hypothetical protein
VQRRLPLNEFKIDDPSSVAPTAPPWHAVELEICGSAPSITVQRVQAGARLLGGAVAATSMPKVVDPPGANVPL